MGGGSGGRWSSLGNIRNLEKKAKETLRQGKKNVFISFAHRDLKEVNLLRAHAKNDNSDIEFSDRSVHEPYNSERADYIRSRLADRINQASTTVVFISANTPQSKWVKWEVEKSIELGKRVIGIYAGSNRPKNLPSWVKEHGVKVLPWSSLADEI